MPFTKEDKILIKNLFQLKGYNAFSQRVFQKKQHLKVVAVAMGWSTVVPVVADDATPALILLTNWCYRKMASREIIII